jgi:hypothetical protein
VFGCLVPGDSGTFRCSMETSIREDMKVEFRLARSADGYVGAERPSAERTGGRGLGKPGGFPSSEQYRGCGLELERGGQP